MKRVGTISVVLVAITLAGCAMMGRSMIELRRLNARKNKPAPGFELTALDGGKVRLSDFRGKPVVLAFWAYG